MNFTLIFTDVYNRRARRWLKRHPDLRKTQPGKSGTNKVDEIPRSLDSRIFDHFVQDSPGK